MSKALLSLYQGYLQGVRVKQFRRYHCFRKYFKKEWVKKYERQRRLRQIISKMSQKESLVEREKYVREFETKKKVL